MMEDLNNLNNLIINYIMEIRWNNLNNLMMEYGSNDGVWILSSHEQISCQIHISLDSKGLWIFEIYGI